MRKGERKTIECAAAVIKGSLYICIHNLIYSIYTHVYHYIHNSDIYIYQHHPKDAF